MRRWLIDFWHHLGMVVFNGLVTHLPGHWLRLGVLRLWGARIGPGTSIFRGTTVLGIEHLSIGRDCGFGFRCMLDARGGLTIGDRVVVASDVHFIGGTHTLDDPGFGAEAEPITVDEYAWITSRATVLHGVHIGRGAVVSPCTLVHKDVPAMSVVAGVPSRPVGTRDVEPGYNPAWRPWGF